jgi:hypothetical protein
VELTVISRYEHLGPSSCLVVLAEAMHRPHIPIQHIDAWQRLAAGLRQGWSGLCLLLGQTPLDSTVWSALHLAPSLCLVPYGD